MLLAVRRDPCGEPEGTVTRCSSRRTFPLRRYAQPVTSTIEDLIGSPPIRPLVDLLQTPRKQRLAATIVNADETPILRTVTEHLGDCPSMTQPFDPMLPAEFLLCMGGRKARKLPGIQEALSRFEKLFADLNASL